MKICNHLISLLLLSFRLAAADLPWEPGKPYKGDLKAGATDSFVTTVKKDQVVTVSLEPRDPKQNLIFSAVGPSGGWRRAFATNMQNSKRFLAREEGQWRFTVAGRDQGAFGEYTLTVRLEPLPQALLVPALASPKLAKLATQRDVDAFWKEIGPQGSPLIEPIPNDATNMLVTFLFRGNGETKSVKVLGDLAQQEGNLMKNLQGTDLWFLTMRVPHRLRTAYLYSVNGPSIPGFLELLQGRIDMKSYLSNTSLEALYFQRDPLNPKSILENPTSPDAAVYRGASLLEMPGAPRQPWADPRPGVPAGKLEEHSFKSAILKNERSVFVYLPPGYTSSSVPAKLLIAFDGRTYIDVVPTPVTLDNLLADRRIGPTIAVIVDNVPGRRSFELSCEKNFSDFLALELLPWIQQNYRVRADAKDVILAGSSLGGLAAACAALYHPERFGNVLSQSGSFWWTPRRDPNEAIHYWQDREPTYIADLFLQRTRLPIRFYLDAGSLETDPSGQGGSILVPNRHLRDVLRAKGYEVFYQEFLGGHDYASWRGTLADGLILLQ